MGKESFEKWLEDNTNLSKRTKKIIYMRYLIYHLGQILN